MIFCATSTRGYRWEQVGRGVARATQHVDELLSGLLAWPIGGFLDAFVYVCVLGLELRVAERLGGQQCQFSENTPSGPPVSY
jgi:hypothetical protein